MIQAYILYYISRYTDIIHLNEFFVTKNFEKLSNAINETQIRQRLQKLAKQLTNSLLISLEPQ